MITHLPQTKKGTTSFETVCCYSRVGQGSPFLLFIRGEMQVCGFVDGLVGGRIYLPACLPPLFPLLFLFLFLDTDHSALGIRRPPAQRGKDGR